jgi:hypothetical protein
MIICPSFPDHWKTRVLRSKIGDVGVLCLLRLWGHCQNRKSQKFEASPQIVASIAMWDGDPELLESALIECRFAKREGEAFVLHEWEQHNFRLMNGLKGGRPQQKPKDEADKKSSKNPTKNFRL